MTLSTGARVRTMASKPENDNGDGNDPRVNMAELLIQHLDRYSLGERLRFAAQLLDQTKTKPAAAPQLISHARHVLRLVDAELVILQRKQARA